MAQLIQSYNTQHHWRPATLHCVRQATLFILSSKQAFGHQLSDLRTFHSSQETPLLGSLETWRPGEGRSRIRDKRSKKQAVWHWCDVTLGINRKHKFSFSVTRKCWCGCLMRGNYHRSGGAPHSKHGNMLPTTNTRPGLLCVVSSFLSFNLMSFNDFPLSWI